MWWDERFTDFDGDVVAAEPSLGSPSVLTASIALDSEYIRYTQLGVASCKQCYAALAVCRRNLLNMFNGIAFMLLCMHCRKLVLAAFDRRRAWSTSVHPSDQALQSNRSSLFYWGEYETIDWEKVHAGESVSQ